MVQADQATLPNEPSEPKGRVIAVSLRSGHHFSKTNAPSIRLIEGLGVDGDGHASATDQHRSHVARDPQKPNLRQVHLIHSELFDELRNKGFDIRPGDIGENITTSRVDLLALPTGTRLRIGTAAIVEITGLRNPCWQLDRFRDGLKAAALDRDSEGNLVRKAGIMSIVIAGGEIKPGDPIEIERPSPPHRPLVPV
jgi:MOSC domain-containing protein YiiM